MQLNAQYTLVPDAGSYPYLPLTGLPYPSEAPPNITNSICSAQFLDNMSVRDRYIMNVKFLIGQVSVLRCILSLLLLFRVATNHSQSPACQMVLQSRSCSWHKMLKTGFIWSGSLLDCEPD